MAKERLLCAATVSRPQCPIIGWIQIQEAKALDRALHFQRISLDDVGNLLPCLFGAVGVKLNAIAKHVSATGDCLKGHAIANTRVDRGRWSAGELEEIANSLGFRQWQRVEPETTFALKTRRRAPFSRTPICVTGSLLCRAVCLVELVRETRVSELYFQRFHEHR